MKLQGLTILITGGSSGIGLSIAKHLASQNVVIICGRSQTKLDIAAAETPGIHTFRCDIAVQAERLKLFQYMESQHNSFDVLINNAAIVHRTDFKTDDTMIVKAESELQINLIAPIALSKMFLSTRRPLALLNITTGLVYAPRAVYPVYNATKAGLHAFTQVLRHQLRNSGIQIIEVMMPVVDTPWHQGKAPKIAISPGEAVRAMLAELEKGKLEIRVGAVKMLRFLWRLSPRLAFRVINRIE